MVEKQIWIPILFKKDNKILLKWHGGDWENYNFIGGKFKEEDKTFEKTVIRKVREELGFEVNKDYIFKKLADKFRFRKKSRRRKIDCYYICYPYLLICLDNKDNIESKINEQNEKLLNEFKQKGLMEPPPGKKILEWFSVDELSSGEITDSAGDIFWNINKNETSQEPLRDGFNDIPDSYDELLIKLKGENIIIGISQRALEMLEDIRKAVEDPFERPVMILGETGCGKSRLARAIHNITRGKGFAKDDTTFFADLTLAGVKDENLQCLLFGYAPGSFTGGNPDGSEGLFKDTDGGTVFLDEITTIKENSQAIFLQTLGVDFFKGATNLSFYRYGGRGAVNKKKEKEKKRTADVRIISATNETPEYNGDKITFPGFRDDLTSRLTDHIIKVPSLNELEDIDRSFIIDSLLEKFSDKDDTTNKDVATKKSILTKMIKTEVSNEQLASTLDVTTESEEVKKAIFDGRYNLSWNFRSLISILAGAVDNAIKEYKYEKDIRDIKIIIKEKHLPVFKKRGI